MALSTLNWKKLAVVTLAGSAIHQILDGVYTALISTTYYNGAARTPGSGSAWTGARYQNGGTTEAVWGTPPSALVSYRAMLAGAAGAKTPTMASPDTWATNTVLASTAKSYGAYNAWDAAAPFTSGQFYGFWRCVASTITITKVHVYENQEELLVMFESNTGLMFAAGWESLEVPSGSAVCSEDSGRRYAMHTTHPTTGITATWMEINTGFLGHTTSTTTSHHMALAVGASSSITAIDRHFLFESSNSSSSHLTDESGAYMAVQTLTLKKNAAAPNDQFIGIRRQVALVSDKVMGTVNQSAGTDVWYNVSGNTGSSGNALALFA